MIGASRFADSPGVFAGIVEIAIAGFALVKGMAMIRRHLLVWHQEKPNRGAVLRHHPCGSGPLAPPRAFAPPQSQCWELRAGRSAAAQQRFLGGLMRRTIGLAGVALIVFGAGLAQAEPLKIRGAWVAPVSNWASIWLEKKDLAKHFGQSYVFEPMHFAGTPPMVTAIANNEAEIGDLAFSTLPIAISNAGLDDIRVIADEFQDGAPGYRDDTYDVLADGPIKKIEDLKGKVVATNAIGSGVDVAMRAMLRKHGLEANRDYTIIEAPFPAMASMLAEKKVALIPAILPFALDPRVQDRAAAVYRPRRDRRLSVRGLDGAQAVHRRASRRAGRLLGRLHCASSTGISIRRTTMRRRRSPRR